MHLNLPEVINPQRYKYTCPLFYSSETLGAWKKTATATYLQFVQDIAPQSVTLTHTKGLHKEAQGGHSSVMPWFFGWATRHCPGKSEEGEIG